MDISQNRTKEDLERHLYDLLLESETTLSADKWLHLNQLWLEPKRRQECSDLIVEYLKSILVWSPDTVLLCLDGVPGAYGVLPLLGGVASELGCKLAIWRELGQVILAEPWLLPSKLPMGLTCVIFQDVINRGTTLVKAIDDLSRVNWSVSHLISLVKTGRGNDSLQSSISLFRKSVPCLPDFEFHTLLNMEDYFDKVGHKSGKSEN